MSISRRCVPVAILATVAVLALLKLREQTEAGRCHPATGSTAENWSGGVPGAGDSAVVVNGGTAAVTQPGETCGMLSLGSSAGSGTIQMSAGGLSGGYEYVGDSGSGGFTQTGGVNSASGTLALGNSVGGNGTYSLSGGSISGGYEYVGNYGSGGFTQTGGTNSASGNLSLGKSVGGSDTYSGGTAVNGGTLTVADTSAIPDGSVLSVGPGATLILDPSSLISQSPIMPLTQGGPPGAAAGSGPQPVPEPGKLVLLAVGGAWPGLAPGEGGRGSRRSPIPNLRFDT